MGGAPVMAFNAVDNLPVQGAWMVGWPFWGGPLDPVFVGIFAAMLG